MAEGGMISEGEAVITGHEVLDTLKKHGAISSSEISVGGSGLKVTSDESSIRIARTDGNLTDTARVHARDVGDHIFARTNRSQVTTKENGQQIGERVEADIEDCPFGQEMPTPVYSFHITKDLYDPSRPFAQKEINKQDIILNFGADGQILRVIVSQQNERRSTGSGEAYYRRGELEKYDNRSDLIPGGMTKESFNAILRETLGNTDLNVDNGFTLKPVETQEMLMDFRNKEVTPGKRIVVAANNPGS